MSATCRDSSYDQFIATGDASPKLQCYERNDNDNVRIKKSTSFHSEESSALVIGNDIVTKPWGNMDIDLEVPTDWVTACDSLMKSVKKLCKSNLDDSVSSDIVIAVCGAKGLGKSTFLRELSRRLLEAATNRDLTKDKQLLISYLDTDLGQPERGAPGIVSLTRAMNRDVLDYAIYIGDNSPAQHPVSYLDACKHIVNKYNAARAAVSDKKHVLLINTHGWNIGFGAELVTSICEAAGVTHFVHLLHDSRPDSLQPSSWKLPLQKKYKLTGVVVNAAYSPAEESFRRFVKYFHAGCLAQLERMSPVRVSACAMRIIYSIDPLEASHMSENQPSSLEMFNGSFVGICRFDCETSLYEFVAYGLVRSIDEATEDLLLLTPLSASRLHESNADCLVLGTQVVPLLRWQQSDSGAVKSSGLKPFFTFPEQTTLFSEAVEKNSKNLKRRRLFRRQKT